MPTLELTQTQIVLHKYKKNSLNETHNNVYLNLRLENTHFLFCLSSAHALLQPHMAIKVLASDRAPFWGNIPVVLPLSQGHDHSCRLLMEWSVMRAILMSIFIRATAYAELWCPEFFLYFVLYLHVLLLRFSLPYDFLVFDSLNPTALSSICCSCDVSNLELIWLLLSKKKRIILLFCCGKHSAVWNAVSSQSGQLLGEVLHKGLDE